MTTRNVLGLVIPCVLWCIVFLHRSFAIQMTDSQISHLKEHMKEEGIKTDTRNMNAEELEWHFFRQHDTDGNRQLDGLELFKGILHAFEHDEDMNKVDETKRNYIIAENHKAAMDNVDNILENDDRNKDGLVSYDEFRNGRLIQLYLGRG